MLSKLVRVIKNPKKIVIFFASRGWIKYDDRKYLEFVYKEKMGDILNLDNPKKYSEKLQWLKLYNRKDEYINMVDKYEVRKYVEEKIGSEYLIPCLGIYDSTDEIDFDKLPNSFVLKTTHDSGTAVICRDKKDFDRKDAIKKLNKSLKRKYFYLYREWPYKNVKPRIIAESYMENKHKKSLDDYKFYCFNGIPKVMFIVSGRGYDPRIDFFDMKFNKLNVQQYYPNSNIKYKKPKQFDEMIRLCKILSKDMPHVRVDFYIIDNKVYFGELTFFDSAGLEKFNPLSYDEVLGSYIDLNKVDRK